MSIGLIVVIVIVAILVIWFIAMYNGFVKIKNRVDEAFATIDVYLKKRYDLIPNLVETVKGYAAHESGTLEKVVQARNMAQSARSDQEKIAADNMLSGTLKSLFAVAEGYPDLKANTNFIDLQNQHIARLENHRCTADAGMIYIEILTDLERMGDHSMNVAEAALDNK